MTRSHAAASAALLACAVLLCAAIPAQVRESEREGFFHRHLLLLLLQVARHRRAAIVNRIESVFFPRVTRPKEDTNYLFSWSIAATLFSASA